MTDHTPSGLPQPQRTPLTHEQIYKLCGVEDRDAMMKNMAVYCARAVEAALSAPSVETVVVQRALDKVRDIWLDWCDNHIQASAAKVAFDRVFAAPLPVAPKAEPTAHPPWCSCGACNPEDAQPVADRSAEAQNAARWQTFAHAMDHGTASARFGSGFKFYKYSQSLAADLDAAMGTPQQAEPVALSPTHERAAPAPEQDGPLVEGWQVSITNGHSGYGAYAHMTEYPEEGAVLLASSQPVAAEGVRELIEKIAQQWDGCEYESVGETIDIGDAIRRAALSGSAESKADAIRLLGEDAGRGES